MVNYMLRLEKRGKFSNISLLNLIRLIVTGYACYHKSVIMPKNNLSILIVKLFIRNNLISGYKLVFSNNNDIYFGNVYIEAFLSYFRNQPAIHTMQTISIPSRPQYITIHKLRMLLLKNIQNIYILNTSHGLLTGKEALSMNIGGELLCILT